MCMKFQISKVFSLSISRREREKKKQKAMQKNLKHENMRISKNIKLKKYNIILKIFHEYLTRFF